MVVAAIFVSVGLVVVGAVIVGVGVHVSVAVALVVSVRVFVLVLVSILEHVRVPGSFFVRVLLAGHVSCRRNAGFYEQEKIFLHRPKTTKFAIEIRKIKDSD